MKPIAILRISTGGSLTLKVYKERYHMAKTLLEQLKEVTVVVADSGDFESIEKFKPQDTTTNPSLLTAAAGMPQYQPIVDGVLLEAKKQLGPTAKDAEVANLAF